MKKVLGNATKYLFGAFALAILGLLMTLTYQALGRIFPTSPTNQIWGLVLFDLAAMIWALAFVFASGTTEQYALAALGFLTGFLGTLLMVAAEVILGQSLINTDIQQIGQWMVYGFIGATVLHAILIYAHHASAQDIRQQIDVGIARGEITSEAIKQATHTLDHEKQDLARTLTLDIVSQVKRDLGLYPADNTPFQPRTYQLTEAFDQTPAAKPQATLLPQPQAGPTYPYPEPDAGAPDNYGPLWKASTDIAPALAVYAWECHCGASHNSTIRTCSTCQSPRTNGSPITAFPGITQTKDEPTAAQPPFPGAS